LETREHKNLEKKLKRWFARTMLARFGAEYKTRGAKFLGVSPDTIGNWEEPDDDAQEASASGRF